MYEMISFSIIIISDRSVPAVFDCCNQGGYLTFGGYMQKKYLKYKNYAHFDKKMSVRKAKKMLQSKKSISEHGFFPFLHYTIKSKKLEYVGDKIYAKKEPKKREIYYCAHFDRYIYQHYAYMLNKKYNDFVVENGIDSCVGAYRIDRGKCNINFAYEMFETIKNMGDSIIIIGDFTGFFDNLDHNKLKRRVEIVFGDKLDDNLYKVYKSLTKFSYVDVTDLYDYYTNKNGKRSEKYYMRKLNQLMTIDEFKLFIKSKNTKTGAKYLKRNEKKYGIVQGSPMSGLFANIYMIEFDKCMNDYAIKNHGKYLRYSDDFMLVIKRDNITNLNTVYKTIQGFVQAAGQIELEKRKTNVYQYINHQLECINELIFNTQNVPNLINFLGFSFDGQSVAIRNKTISKYFYKMNRRIKKMLKDNKSVTTKSIYDKFSMQGENKKNNHGNKGNFITYVKRATKIFSGENKIDDVRKNSVSKVTERIGAIKLRIKKMNNKK